jgi:hypothetical protein
MFLSQRKGSVMIRDVVKSSLNRGDTSVLIGMPKANGTVGPGQFTIDKRVLVGRINRLIEGSC